VTALEVALRGFVIVALVAWNVRHVAKGKYVAAFFTGAAISVCWWLNAGLAAQAQSDPALALAYGVGAGFGTIAGIRLGR
jgi:hypothetical protein